MTDRHAGYLVTLTDDFREDDAEQIINALRMIKCVKSVAPIPADHQLHIAQERVDTKWREALRRLSRDGLADQAP